MRRENQLESWLEESALPGERVVETRVLTGGYSNENLLVVTAGGDRYVLRRFLRSNRCAVEAALVARLAGVVPVAEVLAADPEGKLAGEPVLLSRFVPGTLIGDVLPTLSVAEAAALGRSTGAALAAIGTVTFGQPGFFGDAELLPGPADIEPTAGLPAFVDRCLREGNAGETLTGPEQDALRRFAERSAAGLTAVRGARQLVHADFNPKNLLAVRRDGSWQVSAVLDWEFAFSSSPLFDIGNMLRHERPAGFVDGFLDGYVAGGGLLPDNWRPLSQALDLFSLADLLTRSPDHRYFRRALTTIRQLLAAA
jgi:aminoglycoside phosphotransferase (APT) family kinase protein